MRKRLFRRSLRRRLRGILTPGFPAFLVLAAGALMAGLAIRFGRGTEPPSAAAPSPVETLAPQPGEQFQLSVGPREVRDALTRISRIGHPVRCGRGGQPLVALTFDDGPGPRTASVLRILASRGAAATFFLVGDRLAFPGAPSVEAMGPVHALGNHSWAHRSLRRMKQKERRRDLVRASRAIEEAAEAPIVLVRPPFGHRDRRLDDLITRLGMVQVLWSQTVGDNRRTTAREILDQVEQGIRPGAIVLLHEKQATVAALPMILDHLRERGLRPVTVPELLAADPPSTPQLRRGICPVARDAISQGAGGQP
ncbi:MAG TPA: polysaccharide deacetylase family protein [Actinomycetota bacterium]|jgi:peptidoglycan/xylan/chitin deacetylase (PgdA/CDA1 family)